MVCVVPFLCAVLSIPLHRCTSFLRVVFVAWHKLNETNQKVIKSDPKNTQVVTNAPLLRQFVSHLDFKWSRRRNKCQPKTLTCNAQSYECLKFGDKVAFLRRKVFVASFYPPGLSPWPGRQEDDNLIVIKATARGIVWQFSWSEEKRQ